MGWSAAWRISGWLAAVIGGAADSWLGRTADPPWAMLGRTADAPGQERG
jgi:hypothetical protein